MSPCFDFEILVIVQRQPRERRHRLTLASAGDDANFVPRIIANVFRADHQPRRDLQEAQFLRDFRVLVHSSSEKTHDAAVLFRLIDDELKSRNRRSEARKNDPAFRRSEDRFEAIIDRAFRRRISGVFRIRAVGEKRQHALIAVGGQSVQVEQLSIDRRRIDFEVASVNDCAGGSLDRECERIDDRMRHVKKLDAETADLNCSASA